jgi:hypothetical protein
MAQGRPDDRPHLWFLPLCFLTAQGAMGAVGTRPSLHPPYSRGALRSNSSDIPCRENEGPRLTPRHCEEQSDEAIQDSAKTAGVVLDRFVALLLAMTENFSMQRRHGAATRSAVMLRESGASIHRGVSAQAVPLEYWVARSSRAMTTAAQSSTLMVRRHVSAVSNQRAPNTTTAVIPGHRASDEPWCAIAHQGISTLVCAASFPSSRDSGLDAGASPRNDGGFPRRLRPRCIEPRGFLGSLTPQQPLIRSIILTIFWHCSFCVFSSRTRLWAGPATNLQGFWPRISPSQGLAMLICGERYGVRGGAAEVVDSCALASAPLSSLLIGALLLLSCP